MDEARVPQDRPFFLHSATSDINRFAFLESKILDIPCLQHFFHTLTNAKIRSRFDIPSPLINLSISHPKQFAFLQFSVGCHIFKLEHDKNLLRRIVLPCPDS